MGQPIAVTAQVVDDVVVFDTDRSITGQDGTAYASAEEAAADDRFPGRLATRLFAMDDDIDHVFIASNVVVVRREAGWQNFQVDHASHIVGDFFLFYPETNLLE